MVEFIPMRNKIAYIALILTIAIWGSTFVVTKVVLREIAPLQLTELRFIIAFLLLAPFAARQGFKLKDIFRPEFMLFGLTGTTLYYAFQNIGMTYTSVSSTVLILAIVPALTTILAVIFLKESLNKAQVVGIVLVTIGVVLVSMEPTGGADSPKPWLGNLLIFGSALSWAINTIQGRKLVGEHPALLMTTACIGSGAVMLLPFIGWEIHSSGLPHLSLMGGLGVIFLSVVASALTTYLWYYTLHFLSASVASSFINLVPVFGLAGSYLLGEQPPLIQLLGGCLAILGVLLSNRSNGQVAAGELES